MAELTEGTYTIISVRSGLAIDVKGGDDKSGVNVRQWTPNYRDAQIWAATLQSDGWQFKASLTNKCMDILNGHLVSGTNVRQWDDNNGKNAQRWAVVSDGKTYTFRNKSYPTFYIRPYRAQTLSLDVSGGSMQPGANVQIYTNNSTDAQRWIFFPVPVFTNEGTYWISPAADPAMVADVTSASTANYANVMLYPSHGGNNQIVKTEVDEETFNTTFYFAHSNKCLDVRGGAAATAGTNVIQYQPNGSVAQKWLPIKRGSLIYEGETIPTYELATVSNHNLVLDCEGGKFASRTNLRVWTRQSNEAQRFAFIKTEVLGNTLSAPGVVDQKEFTRVGAGSVEISGLTFQSKETAFQARYKLQSYDKTRSSYTESAWMNLDDDSTSRSGWGDAWTPTFTGSPVHGRVTIPFTKNVTVNATNPFVRMVIENRVYKDNYGSGFKAHGPVKSSTIDLMLIPEVSLISMKPVYNFTSKKLGLEIAFSDSLDAGSSFCKSRILGGDGVPISGWISSSSTRHQHFIGESLLRFPKNGEKLTFEYSLLTTYGASVSGSIERTFSYSGSSPISLSYRTDHTESIDVSSPSTSYEHTFVEVTRFGRTRLVENQLVSSEGGTTTWRCLPPLNRDVKIVKIGSDDGISWTYSETTARVDSHLFIWNWTNYESSSPYLNSAAVIVNSDNPPSQTRTSSMDVKFHSPSGRIRPVAFADRNVSTDMSVKGVVIDEGVEYQAAGPVPDNTKIDRIESLIELSGVGIHPVYRTPYGDWSQVAIESVDISKTERYMSQVSVTQRSVED